MLIAVHNLTYLSESLQLTLIVFRFLKSQRIINPPISIHLCLIAPIAREFGLYFRFFDNFGSNTRALTGQWISGKHLPWFLLCVCYRSNFSLSFYAFVLPWHSYECEKWPSKRHFVRVFWHKYLLRSPCYYLCLMIHNYVWMHWKDVWKIENDWTTNTNKFFNLVHNCYIHGSFIRQNQN